MSIKTESINYDSATFRVLLTCFALLVIKLILMVPLIGRLRFKKKVVMSPEDTVFFKGLKVKYNDPDIERVRRAHRNDLENILIFFNVAFLYTAMKPNPVIAIPLLIAYTIARYVHTYVYAVVVVKQPARLIAFSVGFAITAYMAACVALTFKDFA